MYKATSIQSFLNLTSSINVTAQRIWPTTYQLSSILIHRLKMRLRTAVPVSRQPSNLLVKIGLLSLANFLTSLSRSISIIEESFKPPPIRVSRVVLSFPHFRDGDGSRQPAARSQQFVFHVFDFRSDHLCSKQRRSYPASFSAFELLDQLLLHILAFSVFFLASHPLVFHRSTVERHISS